MSQTYIVGTNTGGTRKAVTSEGEDALDAALRVKETYPDAAITYVRKHNARGDKRHPHPEADET